MLLILVAVSIATLTGENGILTRAQDAKEKTEEAKTNEEEILSQYEDLLYGKSQNTDTEAGKLAGEGTEASPYLIESIEDLVAFSDLVAGSNKYGFNETNEQKTFEGEYVQLATDLDFNSIDSYKLEESVQSGGLKNQLSSGEGFLPIIGTENSSESMRIFLGTFDGNRKEIRNLYQNINGQNLYDVEGMKTVLGGLFGATLGSIQNLGVTGIINAEVNSLGEDFLLAIGGIGGLGLAPITKCYSNINITVDSYESTEELIGGITGWGYEITECYNSGDITTEGDEDFYIGGITGFIQEGAIVKNCYNKGKIKGTGCAGGIVGYFDYGSIGNCYNIGTVEGKSTLGGIAGFVGRPTYLKNSFCIDNIDNLYGSTDFSELEPVNCAIKTESQLKAKDNTMIDLLNTELESPIWKVDTNNINEGYPILSWQE